MVTSLVLLQKYTPTVMQASNCTPVLQGLLDLLDKFNRLAPGLSKDEQDDLAWPGVWGKIRLSLSCILTF